MIRMLRMSVRLGIHRASASCSTRTAQSRSVKRDGANAAGGVMLITLLILLLAEAAAVGNKRITSSLCICRYGVPRGWILKGNTHSSGQTSLITFSVSGTDRTMNGVVRL